jgi:hypothetical protein
MNRGAHEDGFGLAEAIVALAIIALALPACYRAMGGAFRASAGVKTHEAALSLARTQLDTLGADGRMQEGTFLGSYANGLKWRLTSSALSAEGNGAQGNSRPYWVVLEVFDRSERRLLKLETAKLASKTP